MIASTTHKDLHGMRMARQALEGFEKSIRKKYYPLQYNHDDSGAKIGVIVSAKLFVMPDGETALAALVIKHSDKEIAQRFPSGGNNSVFMNFQELIDVNALMIAHDIKMEGYVEVEQSLEEKLESFMQSHIVMPDGQIRTNKYLVTKIKEFRVEIYPKDHRPAHFHLISKKRNIDARFSIETLNKISVKQGKISSGDERLVKLFFKTHPDELTKLKKEAKRLQLEV
ncbi:MAG TPA: DUF4160 domain-containing protein [Candidatus Saccharimonadales bacterium]|nr:DUF4160 domain-containing protein [Candidatus Saccharimonadales bacterium]